jgi:hypothetical protein
MLYNPEQAKSLLIVKEIQISSSYAVVMARA